ncbi:MAG: hypothetical protein R6V02_11140 [Candidatus Aminicenantes bacterium]
MVKPAAVSIELSEGLSLVEGENPAEIGFFAGEFEDDGEDRFFTTGPWECAKTVSWKIKGEGEATVTVRSTRGGTATVAVKVK